LLIVSPVSGDRDQNGKPYPKECSAHQNDKNLRGQTWEANDTGGLAAKNNLNLRTHSDINVSIPN
jgi:hypothetical protein